MTKRALVLAGGGVAGIAWLLGVLTALRDGEVELSDADLLVGTSAGSAVAAQLATGVLAEAAAAQQRVDTAERGVQFDMAAFLDLVSTARAEASSPQDAVRRVAGLPLQQHDVDGVQRRAIVAARLPVSEWPERELAICVVRQDTGERVVLDRHGPAGLVDAVTASCAVPGVWPPVGIAGHDYVDGGAHSFTNADIVAGASRTVILIPVVPSPEQEQQLTAESRAPGIGATFVLAADDEAGASFGPNPLDPSRRPQAFESGRRQGTAAVSRLADFWNDTSS